MSRGIQQWTARVASVLAASLLLGGCAESRSVEAFCSVHDRHKAQYLQAGEAANKSMDAGQFVGGLAQMIVALGDLQRMWEELAEVAPEEIRRDVEVVRDTNQKQLDAATEAVDDPLKLMAMGLTAGLVNGGSMSRVDAYVRDNCDA